MIETMCETLNTRNYGAAVMELLILSGEKVRFVL